MAGHRQEFDRELEALEAKVIEAFAMIGKDLPEASQALLSGDTGVLNVLAEREQVIEALYSQIEELATREILLQSPVAFDLRFLLSVLRIVPDLDRSHHLVVDIAARASRVLSEGLSPGSRGLTERMGSLASDMWRRVADSWYLRDGTAAAWLRDRDDEMDELYASLTAELASGRMALPVTMEMTLVARFYERLGDHAISIAHRVIYLAGSARALSREPVERCGQSTGCQRWNVAPWSSTQPASSPNGLCSGSSAWPPAARTRSTAAAMSSTR